MDPNSEKKEEIEKDSLSFESEKLEIENKNEASSGNGSEDRISIPLNDSKSTPRSEKTVEEKSDPSFRTTQEQTKPIDDSNTSEILNKSEEEQESQDINIEGLASSNFEEEGEWELLKSKLSNWSRNINFLPKSNQLINPTILVIGLISLIVLLKAYSGILSRIARIPLAPGLFELTGVIWLVVFIIKRLMETERSKTGQNGVSNKKDSKKTF